jgi:hypothetical protein
MADDVSDLVCHEVSVTNEFLVGSVIGCSTTGR